MTPSVPDEIIDHLRSSHSLLILTGLWVRLCLKTNAPKRIVHQVH